MKLWHDDVRPAPDGWVRVRTNAEAQQLLRQRSEPDGQMVVTVASLDHDLGAQDADEFEVGSDEWFTAMGTMGQSMETGFDLVEWMLEHDAVPPVVLVHSWNPPGADRMAARLKRLSPETEVHVLPYGSPSHRQALAQL
jgi:hypothetical protein